MWSGDESVEKKIQWCTDSGICSEVTKYQSSQFLINVDKFLFQKETIVKSTTAEVDKIIALYDKTTDEINNVSFAISKFWTSNRYLEILF